MWIIVVILLAALLSSSGAAPSLAGFVVGVALGLPQEAPSPWLARAPPQELDPVGPMTQDGIDPIPTSWYD